MRDTWTEPKRSSRNPYETSYYLDCVAGSEARGQMLQCDDRRRGHFAAAEARARDEGTKSR